MAISARMQRHFGWYFLDAKEMRFEKSVSALMRDYWSKFGRAGEPSNFEMKIRGQRKIRRRGDSQLGGVPLLGDGYLQGAARESAVGSGLLVAGRRGGIAARMVAVFHVGHETGVGVVGQIFLRRGWSGLGISEDRERAAHDAGQDGDPQRKCRGQSSLHGVQGCAHSKGIICLQTVESEGLGRGAWG